MDEPVPPKPLRSYTENGYTVNVFPPMPTYDFFHDHTPRPTVKPKPKKNIMPFDI